ncbi:MAG: glucose-6-phosphate isomerase [Anaerolineales bacterium]|nr:glucose-6-phosphate isomerase [Chloroflexota bacterium]MBL6979917.1 glucose-6-phosphate isomerase [Anaerolineales bacterium]
MNKEITLQLTSHPAIDAGLADLNKNSVIPRIWDYDHTVWKPDPTEITNRLGWLHIIDSMQRESSRMSALANDLQQEDFTDILLLGMGGSSLAPEVFGHTFETTGLNISVLDSTDPGAVQAAQNKLDLTKTVFIVATKSGGTTETLSFFNYFYNQVVKVVGKTKAGEHFVAITDPGSKLVELGEHYKFREIFLNNPNIGGRYSALSFFGLVPAALAGVDVPKLLQRAQAMAEKCGPQIAAGENPGAVLGTILGQLAKAGRDKVTFVSSSNVADFPNWVEQLIAESTGKEGKGILPVVGEPLSGPDAYGDDRVFVNLKIGEDTTHDAKLKTLEDAGHPVLQIELDDVYDLGGQFFIWEFATAVASYFLKINPFDQPNVESAKVLARQMVATYSETGTLPKGEDVDPSPRALADFLDSSKPGDYIAFQAYVQPTPEVEAALQALRLEARERYKVATTFGFGPRFLHSTGQLHKGDAGKGLFVQFTSQTSQDVDIPNEAGNPESSMTFGTLKMSQALGDAQALRDAGRRVISIALGENPEKSIQQMRKQ